MAETFTFDLGSERNVKIYEHNTNVEETIIDVRLFDDDEPTEKGQSMSLFRNYRRESGGCERRQRR